MTSRCIMVIGVPRSGTSATAGVLHRAGVPMERLSMGRNAINPRGYFEDLAWKRANARLAGQRYHLIVPDSVPPEAVERYRVLAGEYQTARLWGMKDPRLCVTARYIWPLLDQVRIVAVRRDADTVVKSIMSQSRILKQPVGEATARSLITRWVGLMDETLDLWGGEVMEMQYEDLVADPLRHAGRLCEFAAGGLDIRLQPRRGAEFIDPRLDHRGRHPRAQ